MKKIVKILFVLIIFTPGSLIFPSLLDKFLFFWLLVAMVFVFSESKLNKLAYVLAFLLIATSAFLYFLDPLKIRLVHYIYKPATWSFYFILLGVIGDFYHDMGGITHNIKK